jgi:hypothetical protein
MISKATRAVMKRVPKAAKSYINEFLKAVAKNIKISVYRFLETYACGYTRISSFFSDTLS